MSTNLPQKSQFLVYQTENGQIKIDVRLENETVWLTQPLMAELFQTSVPNISMRMRGVGRRWGGTMSWRGLIRSRWTMSASTIVIM
jgi:hypothetical protein